LIKGFWPSSGASSPMLRSDGDPARGRELGFAKHNVGWWQRRLSGATLASLPPAGERTGFLQSRPFRPLRLRGFSARRSLVVVPGGLAFGASCSFRPPKSTSAASRKRTKRGAQPTTDFAAGDYPIFKKAVVFSTSCNETNLNWVRPYVALSPASVAQVQTYMTSNKRRHIRHSSNVRPLP
jgi:hypothetical protein